MSEQAQENAEQAQQAGEQAQENAEQAQQAGRAIREACLEAVADGVRTADLTGHASTAEFTDEVIRRTKQKLEVWAAL